jgi:hypothetical protein
MVKRHAISSILETPEFLTLGLRSLCSYPEPSDFVHSFSLFPTIYSSAPSPPPPLSSSSPTYSVCCLLCILLLLLFLHYTWFLLMNARQKRTSFDTPSSNCVCNVLNSFYVKYFTVKGADDQWRYSSDWALASLYGFHDSFIARCGVISSTIDLF